MGFITRLLHVDILFVKAFVCLRIRKTKNGLREFPTVILVFAWEGAENGCLRFE